MELFKNIDKKEYQRLFWYGAVFYGLFFLVSELFVKKIESSVAKVLAVIGVSDVSQLTADQVNAYAPQVTGILWGILLFGVLFVIVQAYNYSFFENLMWNTIFKKKTTFRNTNTFLGLNVVLGIIFSAILFILFLAVTQFPQSVLPFGIGLFFVAIFFSVYLLYVSYISFAKTHLVFRSVKNAFEIGFGALKITFMPLLIGIVIGVIVNAALLLLSFLPSLVNFIVQGITLSAYLAWFRIYFANALKGVKF